ncbi:hypothetical protein K5I29_03715 [Flavobacterium agricola]|uniref:Uncharacterized protein n=1 Tax=Flavobacterium agricola TaxID=2870839 RepID=A0ABY6M1A3_9FLAO|nr:hypothetical protein [Flavobacterium agricola]UYW02027.1 hypothetical protein K5I29_03715 [Flavobacterium agricola]
MNDLKDFAEELNEINEALENQQPDADHLLYDLEKRVEIAMDMEHDPKAIYRFEKLLHKIQNTKKEFDFYDENTIMDYMFPNGQDED